jgi:hypothetical protein
MADAGLPVSDVLTITQGNASLRATAMVPLDAGDSPPANGDTALGFGENVMEKPAVATSSVRQTVCGVDADRPCRRTAYANLQIQRTSKPHHREPTGCPNAGATQAPVVSEPEYTPSRAVWQTEPW